MPRSFDSVFYGAAGGPSGPSDDEFNRVSFLSHFDGENNGVNNVFDDGSASNHTITANGNVTQGSFGPFARPDGEWGVDFDGTGDYLTVAASNDFDVSDGDITIEGFFNFTSNAVASALWTLSIDNDDTNGIRFQRQTTGFLRFDVRSGGSYVVNVTDNTISIPLNTWHHVAVTRTSGGDWKVYVNGVIAISATESASSPDTSGIPLSIGANYRGTNTFLNGRVSNFRVVKGTLVYTSNNFTPPTGKLTAITNTKLLTCQSNRFVDNSASAHTVTPSGNTAVTAFGPFLTRSVYDPAVHGASARFSADGDDLISATVNESMGTGDFCLEGWAWSEPNTHGISIIIDTRGGSGGTARPVLAIHNQGKDLVIELPGGNLTSANSLNQYEWNHVAAVRNSETVTLYVNGVAHGTTISSTTDFGTVPNYRVGVDDDGGPAVYHRGYLCDTRVVLGSPVYTSNFAPPTAPLTAITNTKLLLNMADGQAIDSAAQNNLTLDGNTKISTGQAKFGDTSLLFDGTNDYATTIFKTSFGAGNFTVEYFFRVGSVDTNQNLFQFGGSFLPTNDGGPGLGIRTTRWRLYTGANTATHHGSAGPSNDTWYHIAVVRMGTTTKLYVDGVETISVSDSYDYSPRKHLLLGGGFDGGYDMNGYIDEFRVSYFARYTSNNFTPPSEPFPDKGQ